MMINLGDLVPALKSWILCVDECSDRCTICVELPEELKDLDNDKKLYVALYITSRRILDYRVVAAMHIHFIRSKAMVEPKLLVKVLSNAKVVSRVPPAIEDDNLYIWEAVRWRGIAYAQTILDLEKSVIIRIDPPKDRREREKLRVLLEGKRITIRGKTYVVGGLIEKLSGYRVAPWVYLVPKKNLPKLLEYIAQRAEYHIYT